MPTRRTIHRRPSFSMGRTLAIAVAAAGHLALLLALWRPPAPARTDEPATHFVPREALAVRLLPARPHAPIVLPAITPPHPSPAAKRVRPTAATRAPVITTAKTTPVSAPIDATLAPSAPAYVAGGQDFSHALVPTASPRLPGGGAITGVPPFRMASAQAQGMAGVARLLQVFTGTANRACVDVDRWGTMTEEERIAQHASAADMTRIAIENNCPLPPDTVNK